MSEPGLRYVTIHTQGGMRNRRTECRLGRNSRYESRACRAHSDDLVQANSFQLQDGPLRALIENWDLRYRFHVDLEAGVYTALRLKKSGWIARLNWGGSTSQPSGVTMQILTETIDTGERREIFGRNARRMIIITTKQGSPRRDTDPSIDRVDGWYIDAPAAWHRNSPEKGFVVLPVVNGRVDTPVFTHVGPPETGFPISVIRTSRFRLVDREGNLQWHTFIDQEEVTEFSEESLSSDLFVPPRGFRRVLQLPDEWPVLPGQRLRLYWECLKDRLLAKV